MDFRYHLQNFTRKEYSVLVGPQEHASLSYTFQPEMLEARDFGLVVNLAYTDEGGRRFITTFYNETIDLIEPESTIDAQTFFTYSGILAFVGFVAYIAYRIYFSLVKKKGRKDHGSKHSDSSWLDDTHFKRDKPKKDLGQKKNTNKNKTKTK